MMRSQVLVPLVALAVALQACCCCTVAGGPEPPYTVTPSDEAIQQLEDRLSDIQLEDNTLSFSISEEELTSLIVQSINEVQSSSDTSATPIVNPQVLLRNGRLEFYATINVMDYFTLPGMIAFSVNVVNGELDVTVEEIALGPLPIPEGLMDTVTNMLTESLSGIIQSIAVSQSVEVNGHSGSFSLIDITIANGQMSLTGEITVE